VNQGEIILDFATVGILSSVALIARQDVENSSAGTLLVAAGTAGGAGVGYLLAEQYPSAGGGLSHSTTIGLLLGAANASLLIEPTGADHADSVLGMLVAGTAIGATGGFFYGHTQDLTSGQSLFVGNMMLLGTSTAAFVAIAGSQDGKFGGWEDATLAIGLDGGAIAGAILAPSLDWSPHRAKVVFASTFVGAFIGGMLAGLIDKPENGSATDANGNVVTGALTLGLWAGFAAGVVMTHDDAPDLRYAQPTPPGAGMPTAMMPWITPEGGLGLMAGGSF
jgi:hypothetical protein